MSGWRDPRHAEERAADARYERFRRASGRFGAVLERNIREGRRVATLGSIGDRIAAKKAKHAAKAEEWALRLDRLDEIEPQAFAMGDAAVAEREEDIAQFEKDIRGLSNLPLVGSDKSANDSGNTGA